MSKEKLSEKIWEQSVDWVDGIGDIIGKLATQLGVASEHVYEVYTKQVFLEGVFGVVAGLIIIATLISIGIFLMRKFFKNIRENGFDSFDHGIGMVMVFALSFGISVIVLMDYVQPSFFKLMNPEYYTIKEIFNMVKGVMK